MLIHLCLILLSFSGFVAGAQQGLVKARAMARLSAAVISGGMFGLSSILLPSDIPSEMVFQQDNSISKVFHVQSANADSTGKFSTKLTARKRYLPRVVTGAKQLNDLVASPSKEKLDAFLTDELASLQRAMNLYGLSLRKGEVPDEISRTAERLSDEFVKEIKKVTSASDTAQLSKAKNSMEAYLTYAKIDLQ